MNGISVAGEVASAATALAGLILVYLGSISASYGSYDHTQKGAVRVSHQRRAWLAFVGFIISLLAAIFAVLSKWLPCETLADVAVITLFLAFISAAISALVTVMEIN